MKCIKYDGVTLEILLIVHINGGYKLSREIIDLGLSPCQGDIMEGELGQKCN